MNSWGTLEKETGKRFSPELNITDTNANEELVRKQKKKGIWKGEGIEVTNPSWRKWEPHIRGQGKRKRKRAAEEKTNLSSLFTWQKFRFCECCCKHNNNLYFQETFNAFNFFLWMLPKSSIAELKSTPAAVRMKTEKNNIVTQILYCPKSFLKLPSVESAFLKFRVILFSATAKLQFPEIFGQRAGKCCTWWLYLE